MSHDLNQGMNAPTSAAQKPSIWRTVQAVAWSFLGVRAHSEFQQDIAQTSPYHVIAVGIVGAAVFVAGLMLLVNWVVAR